MYRLTLHIRLLSVGQKSDGSPQNLSHASRCFDSAGNRKNAMFLNPGVVLLQQYFAKHFIFVNINFNNSYYRKQQLLIFTNNNGAKV